MRKQLHPTPNPFAAHRWETETVHRIWIPPDAATAATAKACFISGLRGTGKTVLLNCLDPLAPQRDNYHFLNKEALPQTCIGVYINILSEFTHYFHVLGVLNTPDKPASDAWCDPTHALSLQTYLIFHGLSRVFEVIDDSRRIDLLSYDTAAESAFVATFHTIWTQHFLDDTETEIPTTLLDCARTMARLCKKVRINSLRLYADRVTALIEGVQPIAFYHAICEAMLRHRLLIGAAGEYTVKICLDDVHRFLHADQRLLNSIIAVNKAPIGWNLSFVTGRYDATSTQDAAAPLTAHDVASIDLDYQDDQPGFRRLCIQMYNMRISPDQPIGDEPSDVNAASRRVLGRPNSSVLFQLIMGTTNDRFRDRLLGHLQYVASQLADRGVGRHGENPIRYLPQAYVFDSLFAGDRRQFELFLAKRSTKQIDNYFRQKNVAALVCAANELGRGVPYAGLNVLVSLADGCVRDFLRILSVLYDTARLGSKKRRGTVRPRPDAFRPDATAQIPIEVQSESFVDASHQYLDQFAVAPDRLGRTLTAVVHGVGNLVRLLQTRDKTTALSLPERGAIEFSFGEPTLFADQAARIGLVRQALSTGQYIGVIRIIAGTVLPSNGVPQTDPITFRLHRLTAPAFNVSGRGPLRKVRVPLNVILEFAEDRVIDPQIWAEKVYAQIGNSGDDVLLDEAKQIELFEGGDGE